MTKRRQRVLLLITAVAMVALLSLFALDAPREEPQQLPKDTRGLARFLSIHPTDWRAASEICELVMDGDDPGRMGAWRAAHALAASLAPHADGPRSAFARGGLFHWGELPESDRKEVLSAVAPLMLDPLKYSRMAHPLFELTGDIHWLMQHHPDDDSSLRDLRDLAAMYGHFEDYRQLRIEEEKRAYSDFVSRASELAPSQIIERLAVDPHVADEPLLISALTELHRRPLEVNPNRSDILDGLIGYVIHHRLQPLDGLRAVIRQRGWASDEARAQLADALGEQKLAHDISASSRTVPVESVTIRGVTWSGCGTAVCRGAHADVIGPLPINLEAGASDEVPAYVEVYVDERLVSEGPIVARATVTVVPEGRHRVEITLANRLTRNRAGRSIRID